MDGIDAPTWDELEKMYKEAHYRNKLYANEVGLYKAEVEDKANEIKDLNDRLEKENKYINKLCGEVEKLKKQNQSLNSKRLHSGEKNKKLQQRNDALRELVDEVEKNIKGEIKCSDYETPHLHQALEAINKHKDEQK